ncbi:MAG: ABC transporter ATP-binding protein [Acidimicrobiia bacterium]|nr:ABC transporter ATP-binding protein [Acidimicrobiia bacterium]
MTTGPNSAAGETTPAVELVGLTKTFGDIVAVDGLTLDIAENLFFAIIGPSGCGKTTTLRMIGGFEEPTAGTIKLHGRDVTGTKPYQRPVNTVFQSYALFPHLTIFENVAFGLRRQGVDKTDVDRRVGDMLDLVHLAQTAKRKPRQLSGGQRQRVALARALVNHPRLLLLDEPLGALDLKLRKEMQLELKRIQQEVGITFIHVTHDQEEAMTMADAIAVMRNGRIERMGEPVEIYDDPRTRFVAGFLGASNLMDGTVTGTDEVTLTGGHTFHVGPDKLARANGAVHVGVRPEKIHLTPSGADPGHANSMAGVVTDSSFIGVSTHYLVQTETAGELTVVVQNLGATRFAPRDSVTLSWDPEHTFVVAE